MGNFSNGSTIWGTGHIEKKLRNGEVMESYTWNHPAIWGTIKKPALWVTPARTLSISGLKSRVLKLPLFT